MSYSMLGKWDSAVTSLEAAKKGGDSDAKSALKWRSTVKRAHARADLRKNQARYGTSFARFLARYEATIQSLQARPFRYNVLSAHNSFAFVTFTPMPPDGI